METSQNSIKKSFFKRNLIWIIPVGIIIIIICFFDFFGTTKIEVVDALTGKPVKNISVVQDLTGRGLSGSLENMRSVITIRTLEKKTNSDGLVLFPVKLSIPHDPLGAIFGFFKRVETFKVLGNENYNGFHYGTLWNNWIKMMLPYKKMVVKVTPIGDNISQCNGDSECIRLNAFYWAMKNNDESYCEYMKVEPGRFIGNMIAEREGIYSGKNTCYTYIALAKRDLNLCNKILFISDRGICENAIKREAGKEMCGSWLNKDTKKFAACESLLGKYGCRSSSENCQNFIPTE